MRKTLLIPVSVKRGVIFWDERRMYGRSSQGLSLDTYLVKSENFLLTSYVPSLFPSPSWKRGRVRGKFEIYLARFLFTS